MEVWKILSSESICLPWLQAVFFFHSYDENAVLLLSERSVYIFVNRNIVFFFFFFFSFSIVIINLPFCCVIREWATLNLVNSIICL